MRKEGEGVQQGAAAPGNVFTRERKHLLGGLWRPAVSQGISTVETQLNYSVLDISSFVFRTTLIGVTTHGLGACSLDVPSVYLRVAEIKSWIRENAPGTQDSNCS